MKAPNDSFIYNIIYIIQHTILSYVIVILYVLSYCSNCSLTKKKHSEKLPSKDLSFENKGFRLGGQKTPCIRDIVLVSGDRWAERTTVFLLIHPCPYQRLRWKKKGGISRNEG